jgi:hypothetical protein
MNRINPHHPFLLGAQAWGEQKAERATGDTFKVQATNAT